MVEWIVKRAQGDRARVGTLTGVVCILANVALCAAKGVIGVLSGSVSICLLYTSPSPRDA